eukprot:CAMPEP_0202962716 /NCGR_PEP_ID=MMETSP1396-20130829/6797_1 /ASSEMBLY_ACC=CAM_ASM_000872 /TAXON_ID= /ORGANISM="Pseudokeronopsis sp., Strain Brazil" /LENGTH=85 /DNA_ID=CAMNT_0049683465 /DNA_START=651 /DNA_END=908 /DNA_ORIENTATION=-
MSTSHDKANNKINSRLRYFTSSISTLPGPGQTKAGTQMATEMKGERRDNLVFQDEKFKLRNSWFHGSYYWQGKYEGKKYEAPKEY